MHMFGLDAQGAKKLDGLVNRKEYVDEEEMTQKILDTTEFLTEKAQMLEYTKRKEEENSYKSSMHGVESVRVKAQKRVIEERTTKLSNLMQKRTEFYQIAGNLGQVVSPTKLIGGKK